MDNIALSDRSDLYFAVETPRLEHAPPVAPTAVRRETGRVPQSRQTAESATRAGNGGQSAAERHRWDCVRRQRYTVGISGQRPPPF